MRGFNRIESTPTKEDGMRLELCILRFLGTPKPSAITAEVKTIQTQKQDAAIAADAVRGKAG
jgi:hypothetical protein